MSGNKISTVIISRTDAIGDVVLTLPLASIIKETIGSEVEIIFFGKSYTAPVINACRSIDRFINYDTFQSLDKNGRKDFLRECNADAIVHVFPRNDIAVSAKAAGIKMRIGTTNRLFHWTTCNRLVRLSRKNSPLHEAQLNVKLLKPLGYTGEMTLKEISSRYNLTNKYNLPENFSRQLSTDKFRLVLHPKSNASSRDWSIANYHELINMLPVDKFQFIISGGRNEATLLDEWVKKLPTHVVNLAGKLSLEELIALLNSSNGIVAASTGPLHIASALGKFALGIYPPIRPMHPGRWAPVGARAEFLVVNKECSDCRGKSASCHCINEVSPSLAAQRILQWIG